MKNQPQVIDTTVGDADNAPGTVIIHDEVYGQPSMISYVWDLSDALKELSGESVGELEEEYKHLPEEYARAWVKGYDQGELDVFDDALGLRIEHFDDFLKEHSGEWNYPDDVINDTLETHTSMTRRNRGIKNPELKVIDTTDGDADTIPDTVIIHDLVSGKPSIISLDWYIPENIEELTGPLPEKYKYLPVEYWEAWSEECGQSVLDGYAVALGARIEKFKDFIHSNWGGEWTYPDDVLTETPKK